MTALALIHKDSITEQIAQGRYMKDIAADLGITPAAISQLLSKDPAYQAAREAGIETRLEKYQTDIDTAKDALNLARAREGFRAQAWRAERECPKRWGVQRDAATSAPVAIQINIGSVESGTVVNGESGKSES